MFRFEAVDSLRGRVSRAPAPATNSTTRGRSTYIDNIRVVLTVLVVFYHAAVTYGGAGIEDAWYYLDAPPGTAPILMLFCVSNQAFFMGFFFLIAAYFLPASYDRKGAWQFMTDRLLRLGVPLLVFGFLLNSLTLALARAHNIGGVLALWGKMLIHGQFGSGPLWFPAVLLVLSAAYVIWRLAGFSMIAVAPARPDVPLPGHHAILLAALLVGAGSFVLRLFFPLDKMIFDFTIGYFSSYIVLFVIGLTAARSLWLERVPASLAIPWVVVSGSAFVIMLVTLSRTRLGDFSGGWTLGSLIYSFFEPFFACGVILGLLLLFHTYFNAPNAWTNFLARRAYTVYIIHAPVLVLITRLLSHSSVPLLIEFVVAGVVGSAASFALASVILLIPGVKRIV